MSLLRRIAWFMLGRAAFAADKPAPARILDDPFVRSADLTVALLDDARRSNAAQPEDAA